MNLRVRVCCQWLVAILLSGMAGSVAATDPAVERLKAGGVLLLRHAIAPGFGDPAGFRVEDCSTQRNLSEEGRRQAGAIGAWLRARGIGRAKVYSSQWCRCLETAALLNIGEVSALPALNSFFQRPDDRAPNLAALRDFLSDQALQDGPLVLVTHRVTVTALTGVFPDSGEGVVATLGPNGELSDFARLSFGD
jgi:broad specificity phosphatase PhoE